MRLITAQVFSQRYFDPDCRPDKRTVRAWVEKGRVPGKVVEPHIYVDADAWEASTGDAIADKILSAA
jgi:hypothetical protein